MMSVSTVSLSNPILRLVQRIDRSWLFFVVAILNVGGYVLIASVMDEVGFPLDDSWIHQTFARNLAENGEWAFVPGKPSTASTAPLYTLLMTFGHLLRLVPFFWAHLIGVITLFAAGIVAANLAERLFPNVEWVGVGTGLLIMMSWHVIWAAASGMETMLFIMLSLAVISLVWKELDSHRNDAVSVLRRGGWVGVIGGLLFLTRPEGIVLLGLAGLLVILCEVHEDREILALWAVGVAIGFVVTVMPYMIFNLSQTRNFLPATADAKIAENAPLRERFILLRYLRMLLPLMAGGQFLWIPAIIWAMVAIARSLNRRKWLLFLPLLWGLAHLSIYAIRLPAPYQHGRYVIPILPVFLLYAVGGMILIVKSGSDSAPKRVLSRTLALSAILAVLAFWVLGGQAYGRDVRIINTEMVQTAKWIRDNAEIIPENELLAVHDIGAVGYYAPREIFDLAGLISPEVVPIILDHEALMDKMCEVGARWLMVLPEQQPATDTDPRLELVYSTHSPYIIDAGGKGNMKVFRLRFRGSCD